MFNLFKKDCSECKEHGDLEKLRELQRDIIRLRQEVNTLQRESVFNKSPFPMFYNNYNRRAEAHKIAEIIEILLISGYTNYENFEKTYVDKITSFSALRSLHEYLDRYYEYVDTKNRLNLQIKINKEEINEIKERLGIQ